MFISKYAKLSFTAVKLNYYAPTSLTITALNTA